MADDHPAPAVHNKQRYGCCTRLIHDTLWWMIVGYHVYTIISGISPFGIL